MLEYDKINLTQSFCWRILKYLFDNKWIKINNTSYIMVLTIYNEGILIFTLINNK